MIRNVGSKFGVVEKWTYMILFFIPSVILWAYFRLFDRERLQSGHEYTDYWISIYVRVSVAIELTLILWVLLVIFGD